MKSIIFRIFQILSDYLILPQWSWCSMMFSPPASLHRAAPDDQGSMRGPSAWSRAARPGWSSHLCPGRTGGWAAWRGGTGWAAGTLWRPCPGAHRTSRSLVCVRSWSSRCRWPAGWTWWGPHSWWTHSGHWSHAAAHILRSEKNKCLK